MTFPGAFRGRRGCPLEGYFFLNVRKDLGRNIVIKGGEIPEKIRSLNRKGWKGSLYAKYLNGLPFFLIFVHKGSPSTVTS